jgi:enoyl-CoA hydratase/carnithine racemase
MPVHVTSQGSVTVITLDRPEVRNAVDSEHAAALYDALLAFDADPTANVAVLAGAGGYFCSGADLHAVSTGSMRAEPPSVTGPAPMGPTRLELSKPVIAAVSGYAVAGGLELALWCDLRVLDPDAVMGVFCRRWGVPLVDGGTFRLARLIGRSRAMDLILTGRAVGAAEALAMGLANRVSGPGRSLEEALQLAEQIAALPQECLRSDRQSLLRTEGQDAATALGIEWEHGAQVLASARAGAERFAAGDGRHGRS